MKSFISILNLLKRQVARWLDYAPESTAVSGSEEALESTRREIEKIDQAILRRHIVGRAKEAALRERDRLCRYAQSQYNTELEIIHKNLLAIRRAFAELYEAWKDKPCLPEQYPAPMDDDLVIARGCRLGALLAVALDVMLVTFLMEEYYGLIVAFLTAFVMTPCVMIVTDKAIAVAARREAPHLSLDLITRYVFWPALIVTLPAIMVVLAARYISGLPDWISGLFDLLAGAAALVATPGLMLLGGALLAIGNLYAWSLPLSRSFDQLIRQHRRVRHERDQFLSETNSQGGGSGPRMPPPIPSVALIFALALSGFLTGCGKTQNRPPAVVKHRVPVAMPVTSGTILKIEIDRSRSVAEQACEGAAISLHRQLAPVTEAMQATEVQIKYFKDDGWSPPVAFTLALPQLQAPPEPIIDAREFANLPNRKKDLERRKRKEWEQAMKQAAEQYRTAQAEALAKVSVAMLDPCVGAESRCTDVYGALARISAARRNVREVYVMVTDGYSTCQRSPLAPLTDPQGNVKVVILLAAALANEGEGKRPAEQFQSRRAALQKIAPWAMILPAFESNLADYVRAETTATKPAAEMVAGTQ